MNQMKEIFFRDIEANIAPVIYFNAIEPQKVQQEVGEYVFTTRPFAQGRKAGGIHEQMVGMLQGIQKAIQEGHQLPAVWISGFFGSGKSSFAKLLGLSFDNMVLPNGKKLEDVLIERDDTPNANELKESFQHLREMIQPMAVVFDTGGNSRGNEFLSRVIYRRIMNKLGLSEHDGVSNFELGLYERGKYDEFLKLYEETYKVPWSKGKNGPLAPDEFNTIYQKLHPGTEKLKGIGIFKVSDLEITQIVTNILKVLDWKNPGKTLFIVIDEVSQYLGKDHDKMLDLQSFVSEIGKHSKPNYTPLWILVTGQEKLEEESTSSVLFKLKDRFPEELRVHLDRANVKEVVSRRLLKKKPNSYLHSFLNDSHINLLKLYAYDCKEITRDQILESYPLLPSHIPLFMDITQKIRTISTKSQSDAGGVRSVLNNIWDLFNKEPVLLKEKPIGTLVTLDLLYDIIGSSLNSEISQTLHKVLGDSKLGEKELKIVKAIALLEMNSDVTPVTEEYLATILYPTLGSQSILEEVKLGLDTLKIQNWISQTEKNGWMIQNDADQNWNRKKKDISIDDESIVAQLKSVLKQIFVDNNHIPSFQGTRFPLECFWLEEKSNLFGKNDPTQVRVRFYVDFKNTFISERMDQYLEKSRLENQEFHWVGGDASTIVSMITEIEKSERTIKIFKDSGTLSYPYQQRMYREQGEISRIQDRLKSEIRQMFMTGRLYFQGTEITINPSASFELILKEKIESKLSVLYHKFSLGSLVISENEYKQLLNKDLGGLSTVFFGGEKKMGIVKSDSGKTVFSCEGEIPKEVLQKVLEKSPTGDDLLDYFGRAPYGYSSVVIKSSVIGLLGEGKIQIRHTSNNQTVEIKFINDPGARTVFESPREFQKSIFEKAIGDGPTVKEMIAIRKFLQESLLITEEVNDEKENIVDHVFRYFPMWKTRVGDLQIKIVSLSLSKSEELVELDHALTEILENRYITKCLERVIRNLEVLKKGIQETKALETLLTESTITELKKFQNGIRYEATQLGEIHRGMEVEDKIQQLKTFLASKTPYLGYSDYKPLLEEIQKVYKRVRKEILSEQVTVLEENSELLKSRKEFMDLKREEQDLVLRILEQHQILSDENAIQPSLSSLQKSIQLIRDATSQAHLKIDELTREKGKPTQIVRLGLRNRTIESKEELENLLKEIREKCMYELESGSKIRLDD